MQSQSCRAIVTGGASGLGEATVRNIIGKGGKAVILDQSEENGSRLKNELGEATLLLKADVTKEKEIQEAINHAADFLGEINTVVNCAGIGIADKVLGKKGV